MQLRTANIIRFILSHLTWAGLLFYVAAWVDSNPLSYPIGITDVAGAAFWPAVLVAFLNLIIWFGADILAIIRQRDANQAAQQQVQQTARTQTEKRKRETLDTVLRDLSDEQLDTLRQRLSDGTIDDDVLERRIVGADGELVQQHK
jgi:hypothetical protein